ncbi:hypothetical protein NQ317_007149 [Molorchus minor]|uniref:Cyclic nucleotide-binding domain-containing protein n=1 Tax=Molorchus minor TaxID=1323400 RepID=A0ABQ9J541_9CUCU|nr:hypothetical protein NQ317_007149 [Molorchus minor]
MTLFEDHECRLQSQEEDVIKQFVDSGMFISLRRKFRKMCLISKHHPQTSGSFQSHTACRNEQIRNLVHYYYTIHPFSMFDLYWQFFVFFIFATHFLLIPIDALYQVQIRSRKLLIAKYMANMFQLMDIIKIFYTGIYKEQQGRVILKRSSIAWYYLRTYFFIDVISSLYSYNLPLLIYTPKILPRAFIISVRMLNRLKILRISRWLDILELFLKVHGLLLLPIQGHQGGADIYRHHFLVILDHLPHRILLRRLDHMIKTDFTGICKSYFNATLMLLVISYGSSVNTVTHYASTIFFLCFGFSLQMYLYTQILQVWTKYANAQNKHNSLHKQFKEYMKYKVLPVSLRDRIFAYFEFKFHQQFFKEDDIIKTISPILKQEILLQVTRDHIEKVDIFKQLPEHILMKVVSLLRSEIFLPGDEIVSAGTPGNCMFFIYHGTVAVFTPQGKEVCHLEDGTHFGEIAIIFNETRVATVIAVTACELFVLRRSDFLQTIEPFPDIKEQLINLANERLHTMILESKK